MIARLRWQDDYRAARTIRRFEDRFRARLGVYCLSVALQTVTAQAYVAAGRHPCDPLTRRLLLGFPRIVRRLSA